MSLDAAQAALEQSQRELSTSREEMLRQGLRRYFTPLASVADPDPNLDPDPPDPRVFGPPGSGSFYH